MVPDKMNLQWGYKRPKQVITMTLIKIIVVSFHSIIKLTETVTITIDRQVWLLTTICFATYITSIDKANDCTHNKHRQHDKQCREVLRMKVSMQTYTKYNYIFKSNI